MNQCGLKKSCFKKIPMMLGITLLYILLFSFTASAEMMLKITSSSVNIRSGPGTGYEKVGAAKINDQYRVIRIQDGWYQIEFNDAKSGIGWVIEDYVKTSTTDKLPVTVSATSSAVNVRLGPGTNYAKVDSITVGRNYTVVGESKDWYKITLNDKTTGYLAKWLVKAVFAPDVNPYDLAGALKKATINVANANMRATPGSGGSLVGTLKHGATVALVERSGDWYNVIAETGLKGWIVAAHMDMVNVVSSSVGLPEARKLEWGEGTAAAGLADMSWQSKPYGLDITISSDIPIVYRLEKELNGFTLHTDMLIEGESRGFDDILFTVTGDTLSKLVVSGNKPVQYLLRESDNGRKLHISVSYSALLGKVVYIDAGHAAANSYGTFDPGAIGPSGLKESDVVLAISYKLKALLEDQGAIAYMTHTGKTYLTRFERTALANEVGADIFVCIHCNASTSSSVKGAMIFTYCPPGNNAYDRNLRYLLSNTILDSIVKNTGRTNLGIREENYDVLVGTNMPAVLVETAFISNPEEEKLLASDSFQQKMADAICRGIADYFSGN